MREKADSKPRKKQTALTVWCSIRQIVQLVKQITEHLLDFCLLSGMLLPTSL